jgi:cell wall assembly regulator SMI1
MNKFQNIWQQWIAAINNTKLTSTAYFNLIDGIAPGDEKMYELQMKQSFPADIIAFYTVNNVAYNSVASAFSFSINGYSYDLLPFKEIAERYDELLDVGTSHDEQDCELSYRDLNISNKINIKDFTNPKWIPFAYTDQGDYLLYDTDPTAKGTYGQIVELQNDSWQRNVVANSLEDLIAQQIQNIKDNPKNSLALFLLENELIVDIDSIDESMVQVSPIQNITYSGIAFKVINRHDAHEILKELTDVKNENLIYNVFDTTAFPKYDNDGFFLLCEDDAIAETLVLDNQIASHPEIKLLGFIFLKGLTLKTSLSIFDSNFAPALIVLQDLSCLEIKLAGNIHYIGDSILDCDVIWCKHNHGALYVKNSVIANVMIVQDMHVEIRTVEQLTSIVHIGDLSTYTLRSYYNEKQEIVNELFLVTDTHSLQDVINRDCIETIDPIAYLNETSIDENVNVNQLLLAGYSITNDNFNFELENHDHEIDKVYSGLEDLQKLLTSDYLYRANEHDMYQYLTSNNLVEVRYFSNKHKIQLYILFYPNENKLTGGYDIYKDDVLKCRFNNLSLAEVNPLSKSILYQFTNAVDYFKTNCGPIKIKFPNPFGAPLPTEAAVEELRLTFGFSTEYAAFLITQNGFSSDAFNESTEKKKYLAGSSPQNSYQDFRNLHALNAKEDYNDLIKNQEHTIFKDYFFIIGSDCAGNEFVEVKSGSHQGKIGCIDHELYAGCDTIKAFFEELDLGDYAKMTADERLNELLDEEMGLIAFHANDMLDFIENCFLYSEKKGITIRDLNTITIEPNTNYPLNKETLEKMFQYSCVPNDENLEFSVDDTTVLIRKPYIDEKGFEMGNTINFWNEDIAILILNDYEEPRVMFKDGNGEFEYLESDSPSHISNYLNQLWPKIMIDVQERDNAWNGVGNKLTYEDFEQQFGKYNMPKDLKMLFDFQQQYGTESFSECFYLKTSDKSGLKSWSENEKFLNAFVEFATANGSGSSYSYWINNKDIEKCPVVVFGDEGGIHVVANSTKELIHLLTYDVEISVDHEGVSFYKDEDEYEESENKKEFAEWAKTNFKLEAIETDEETESIINAAQKKYQGKLNAFLKSFGIEL